MAPLMLSDDGMVDLDAGFTAAYGLQHSLGHGLMDFYILHELAHRFSVTHPGSNPATTERAYNRGILARCFPEAQ